jgi:hypothetical protein
MRSHSRCEPQGAGRCCLKRRNWCPGNVSDHNTERSQTVGSKLPMLRFGLNRTVGVHKRTDEQELIPTEALVIFPYGAERLRRQALSERWLP